MSDSTATFPVVLHGAYHTDNYGDMLLMLLYRRWLEDAAPNVEVRMPFVTQATASRLPPGPRRGVRGLIGARAFVFGGGGYFGEPPRDAARWSYRLVLRHLVPGLAAAKAGAEVLMCGVGAGPLRHPLARVLIARLLRDATLVTVRDEASRTTFVDLGTAPDKVSVTADAALTLRPDHLPGPALERARAALSPVAGYATLGVHVSRASAGAPHHARVLDDVVRFARERPDLRIVALTDQTGAVGQAEAQDELHARVPGHVLRYRYTDPWELSALLAELDLVITTKLHVGIVAVALGTAVLAYPAHTKTPRFYEQIGAPEVCRPLETLQAGDIEGDLRRRFGHASSVISVPKTVRAAAAANRDLLQARIRASVAARRATPPASRA